MISEVITVEKVTLEIVLPNSQQKLVNLLVYIEQKTSKIIKVEYMEVL
jgi:hypothetical protein